VGFVPGGLGRDHALQLPAGRGELGRYLGEYSPDPDALAAAEDPTAVTRAHVEAFQGCSSFPMACTGSRCRAESSSRGWTSWGSSSPLHQASRPLLEAAVRTRVRGLANVEILDGCAFVGLVTNATRDRVTSARVVRHGATAEQVLTADLVIDATGRWSRTPARLAEIGYQPPAEDEVVVDLRYASRLVRLAPGAVREQLTLIGPTPGRPCTMGLFAYENDTWMFTVSGYAGHHPTQDYQAMVDFAAPFTPPHMVTAAS
jgi:hypothetical protein